MDETYSRSSLRDRILNDLRNVVKQIYHESVNNELSPENKTYICLTLIKNLDEVLRHGLKQLHLGYWKPICQIIHPQTLKSVEQLPYHELSECDGLTKGKAWIALSLKDDSLVSYIHCLINEGSLNKFYEDWSILMSNDSCNKFLSVLSGLDNVCFSFEIEFLNKPPTLCNFSQKTVTCLENNIMSLNLNESKSSIDLTTSSTSLTSPVDSGVHTQESTSDMDQLLNDKQTDIDFLNGNITETVLLRKRKKNTKRHVSFHEDIIYKSPDKCRKLKWDSENLRYSWSGEQIDSSILKEPDFLDMKLKCDTEEKNLLKNLDMKERGTPEGEETPSDLEIYKLNNSSQKSAIVKRFLLSIKKQSKIKQLCKKYQPTNSGFKKYELDSNLISEINNEVDRELKTQPKSLISKYEVHMNPLMVKDMIQNQKIYKAYELKNYLFIITNSNVYLINRSLEMKRISFKDLWKVVVYPDSHVFLIYESEEEFYIFITGNEELTNEVLGRLEYSMRRNQYDPPQFFMLSHSDMSVVYRHLVENLVIEKKEELVYCGAIFLDKEHDLLSTVLPTSKRGFLMYRDLRNGDNWIPGDFHLKNGILYLFEESKFPRLAINISTGCQSCSRTKNPDRPHTFQISLVEKNLEFYSEFNYSNNFFKAKLMRTDARKLFSGIRQKMNKMLTIGSSKETGCVLEFATANEYELCEWIQMIIQASCGDSCEEAHKDLIQGNLWLTSNSLAITNDIWYPSVNIEVLSCAQLRDIAAIRLGESEKDYFTVIEFICMEANSTSGDWILYMSSRQELEKLLSILEKSWKFNDRFPRDYLKEGRLLSRCKKSQESLSDNCWALLLQ